MKEIEVSINYTLLPNVQLDSSSMHTNITNHWYSLKRLKYYLSDLYKFYFLVMTLLYECMCLRIRYFLLIFFFTSKFTEKSGKISCNHCSFYQKSFIIIFLFKKKIISISEQISKKKDYLFHDTLRLALSHHRIQNIEGSNV